MQDAALYGIHAAMHPQWPDNRMTGSEAAHACSQSNLLYMHAVKAVAARMEHAHATQHGACWD
jgi:hypothetical protein